MRRVLVAAAGLLLIAAAPQPDVGGLDAEIERISALADGGRIKDALKQLDKAERDFPGAESRARIGLTRGFILWFGLKDRQAAASQFEQAEAIEAGQAIPLTLLSFGSELGDLDLALHGLKRLIASYPDVARERDPDLVGKLLSGLYQAGRHDERRALRSQLGRIGFGSDWLQVRDNYAVAAIDDHLARGESAEAQRIAESINDRSALLTLLTHRDYEQLWPSIEARVGERMEQPATAAVLIGERLFREAPDKPEVRHALFVAYRDAGRLQDANRIAADFAATPADAAKLTEAGGWLIDAHADVLRRMDKRAEADARYAALLATPMAEKPWLISMYINRLAAVLRDDPAAVGPKLGEAEDMAAKFGSPYARQVIRKYRVCHAVAVRSEADATDKAVAELLAHAKDAPSATIEALMCAGRSDAAAAMMIDALQDRDYRWTAITMMQPEDGATADPDWVGNVQPLLARADVKAAFDKVGRVLPARFRHPG